MALLDCISKLIETGGAPNLPDAIARLPGRNLWIDDRPWMVRVTPPGFVQHHIRNSCQLWTPATDEHPVRVMVEPLLDRVVDANRVD